MSKKPKPKDLKAARASRDRMAEILGEEFTVTVETNKGEVTLGFLRGDKFCMGLSVPSANSELGLQTVAQLVRLKLKPPTTKDFPIGESKGGSVFVRVEVDESGSISGTAAEMIGRTYAVLRNDGVLD